MPDRSVTPKLVAVSVWADASGVSSSSASVVAIMRGVVCLFFMCFFLLYINMTRVILKLFQNNPTKVIAKTATIEREL